MYMQFRQGWDFPFLGLGLVKFDLSIVIKGSQQSYQKKPNINPCVSLNTFVYCLQKYILYFLQLAIGSCSSKLIRIFHDQPYILYMIVIMYSAQMCFLFIFLFTPIFCLITDVSHFLKYFISCQVYPIAPPFLEQYILITV